MVIQLHKTILIHNIKDIFIGFVTRVTRRVPHVEQELLSISQGNTSSLPLFVGFALLDVQFSVQCFIDRCLSFRPLSFGYCIVCLSSIYGFSLIYPFGIFSFSLSHIRQQIVLKFAELNEKLLPRTMCGITLRNSLLTEKNRNHLCPLLQKK